MFLRPSLGAQVSYLGNGVSTQPHYFDINIDADINALIHRELMEVAAALMAYLGVLW